MPIICQFYGIIIQMFYAEHAPAHFHAQYGEYKAIIGIDEVCILEGLLPPPGEKNGFRMGSYTSKRFTVCLGSCQKKSTFAETGTFGVTMYYDIQSFQFVDEREIFITFADGLSGLVEFKPNFFQGVFEPLADPDLLHAATLENGVLMWPGELDIAPDALHKTITQYQKAVLQ